MINRAGPCKVEGCKHKERNGSGYCQSHYNECPSCHKRIHQQSRQCADCSGKRTNVHPQNPGYRYELLDLIELHEGRVASLKTKLQEYDNELAQSRLAELTK